MLSNEKVIFDYNPIGIAKLYYTSSDINKIIWIIDYFTSKNDYIHKDKSHIPTTEKLDK